VWPGAASVPAETGARNNFAQADRTFIEAGFSRLMRALELPEEDDEP